MARAVGERDTEAAKKQWARCEKKSSASCAGDILPFWLKHAVDEAYGGFAGRLRMTYGLTRWHTKA
jgi:mannose/cellobiose epimerase-like protein (N-acyl-D-glucosamine 2-epimerase family)